MEPLHRIDALHGIVLHFCFSCWLCCVLLVGFSSQHSLIALTAACAPSYPSAGIFCNSFRLEFEDDDEIDDGTKIIRMMTTKMTTIMKMMMTMMMTMTMTMMMMIKYSTSISTLIDLTKMM